MDSTVPMAVDGGSLKRPLDSTIPMDVAKVCLKRPLDSTVSTDAAKVSLKRPLDSTTPMDVAKGRFEEEPPVCVKKATPARFDINPNAVCSFECVPKDKINDALEFINAVKGVKRATRGDNDGEIVVLFAGESRFRRNITCLDGPDWRMKWGGDSAQLSKNHTSCPITHKGASRLHY